MGGDKDFGITKRGTSRGFAFAMICLAALAAGCSKSDKEADSGVFDTSRLPRVTGAKEVFASPASTIFTSPDSVAQTADTVDKALAAAGWQKYIAPHTAYSQDEKHAADVAEEGLAGAERVHHRRAGAEQRHQRSISALAAQKRSAVCQRRHRHRVFDPNRPLLTFVTAEPIDKTLDFYRKELGAAGLVAVVAKAQRQCSRRAAPR